MSERKWTPGPWFVGKDLSIGPNGQGVSVIVAACDYDHADANAHLIAAAPDLYDALDNLVRAYHQGKDVYGWIDNAGHALAKAEGWT
jgi:hypothetical protein